MTILNTVIIPMAGKGSRFASGGYTNPKPFIDVNGVPMIEAVIKQLPLNIESTEFIFVCQKAHMTEMRETFLKDLVKHSKIVLLDGFTQGSAISVALGVLHSAENTPLYIINCDQLVSWDDSEIKSLDADGVIVCFEGSGNNWSYAKCDSNGNVIEVAEKRKISNLATAGVYYWRTKDFFIDSFRHMVAKHMMTNNEFYMAPAYNELILNKNVVKTVLATKIEQLGTPGELVSFLNCNKIVT